MTYIPLAFRTLCICCKEPMELFRKAFGGTHNRLVNEIDVDNGLWVELRSRYVLTEQQLRNCKSEVCHC